MPLLDITFITQDEDVDPIGTIKDGVGKLLQSVPFDTYSEQYVIHVVVRKIVRVSVDDDDEFELNADEVS